MGECIQEAHVQSCKDLHDRVAEVPKHMAKVEADQKALDLVTGMVHKLSIIRELQSGHSYSNYESDRSTLEKLVADLKSDHEQLAPAIQSYDLGTIPHGHISSLYVLTDRVVDAYSSSIPASVCGAKSNSDDPKQRALVLMSEAVREGQSFIEYCSVEVERVEASR